MGRKENEKTWKKLGIEIEIECKVQLEKLQSIVAVGQIATCPKQAFFFFRFRKVAPQRESALKPAQRNFDLPFCALLLLH